MMLALVGCGIALALIVCSFFVIDAIESNNKALRETGDAYSSTIAASTARLGGVEESVKQMRGELERLAVNFKVDESLLPTPLPTMLDEDTPSLKRRDEPTQVTRKPKRGRK